MINDYDLKLIKSEIKKWITSYIFTTATIDSVTTDGCTVIFAGESIATQKRYKRLDSVNVTAGDKVLMARLGSTYLILGKII